MEPILRAGDTTVVGKSNWTAVAVVAVIVLLGLALVASTAINGPGVWAAIEQRNAAEVEQEDLAFCTKFGMASDTETFATCTSELAQVRQQQSARIRRSHF